MTKAPDATVEPRRYRVVQWATGTPSNRAASSQEAQFGGRI